MLTIGRLATYLKVSTKTIRVYHAKGLLPEPARDASGYRRYDARHAIDLIRIRTLAEAGVPLARIRDLRSATVEEYRLALDGIDADLSARIRGLQEAQDRLRQLIDGQLLALPAEVEQHLANLTRLGFSQRFVDLQTDLWTLMFATRPDDATTGFREEVETLAEPALRGIVLAYDHAHDLDPHDPRIDELARRIADAVRERYALDELRGRDARSEIPALVQATVNASSPAWHRLDTLIREHLAG